MKAARIEIIAVGRDNVYSEGAVNVSEQGDVYVIGKTKGGDFHTSRHTSGETHWKIKNKVMEIRKGSPIKNFKGIEYLGTHAFGLKSLPFSMKLGSCS